MPKATQHLRQTHPCWGWGGAAASESCLSSWLTAPGVLEMSSSAMCLFQKKIIYSFHIVILWLS